MKHLVIIIFGTVLLSIIINSAANWLEGMPSPPEQKFKVVDNYNGCDLVRWSDHGIAEYKYFLYCPK